ncbi:type II secretion system F family protein [Trinickia caryophylli]|uniref:Tight adherence protein C n=1 Tax=Trinickia caryophylli TaxID=28094 RepID=A0A1X7G9F3_TRICW|nr:type II secretion system F family protein [Trinickia caryophylli]PMS11379.1 type II secretion system F family protein [Trinickia caryophylli]TRX17574.1 type II secretion system F family protein [Trinickia caryophylli]WQE11674.1 type II secretion system F family protein [Trinickia caryophylli]SMF66329.1 tight adherence protein C [Trinickia caryophylli]GLU34860.1 membrane protein [Trinickia caryophylli]
MQSNRIFVLALALAALGLLLLAAGLLARLAADRRSDRVLRGALERRARATVAPVPASAHGQVAVAPERMASRAGGQHAVRAAGAAAPASGSATRGMAQGEPTSSLLGRLGAAGARWLETKPGRQIVAAEDRLLLDQCGFIDVRARGIFLLSRIAGAAFAPLVADWAWGAQHSGLPRLVCAAAALTAGFLAPKLALQRRAAMRRRSVADEMPVLVDLLRLLQGVGLSLDQSLQVMVNDFRSMLPVLSGELEVAQRQFAAGRTREQSMQRLANTFGNEDLRAVVRLMIQVDRHGGAVQEPLRQFGERLRETRRAMLRERIGRLTVKMTGVMIVTLLPALLIVTAGPGLLAVTQMLGAAHR